MFARRCAVVASNVANNSLRSRALIRPLSTYYSKSHEWIKMEGDIGTIGITEHAAEALGDIVYVELPDQGDDFDIEDRFGCIETVKAVSDLYMPVGGEITEVNETLSDTPELLSNSPLEDGWIAKVKIANKAELEELLDVEAYKKFAEEEDSH